MIRDHVCGYCPACGSANLMLGDGGHIVCSWFDCPRPTAVDELLDDRETEHVIDFGTSGFTVRHPLRERLDDALMDCALHHHIAGLSGPPVRPGRYRASSTGSGWSWEALSMPDETTDRSDR